jgi:hypothetical protein
MSIEPDSLDDATDAAHVDEVTDESLILSVDAFVRSIGRAPFRPVGNVPRSRSFDQFGHSIGGNVHLGMEAPNLPYQ